MAKKEKQIPAEAGKVGYCKPPVERQFKPGNSANPKGRPAAGATIKEWFNAMADYSGVEIDAVISNPEAPRAKVAAARAWRDACNAGYTATGSPVAGNDLDRIFDR